MAISTAVKNNAQSRGAIVQAYYPIAASDWGVGAPGSIGTAFSAGANLSASASGGSLATSTGAFKITWVTANGESLPSVEATVSVTGATGSVTVSLASVGSTNTGAQALAAPIIGWNIYSGNGSGNEAKNTGTNSDLSVTLSSVTLASGAVLTYIPIATTSAVVKVYGNGAIPPVIDNSGINATFPAIATNVGADVFAIVPFSFSPFRPVLWDRPNAIADASGIVVDVMDCVAPLWPASTSVTAGQYIVVANKLFICSVAGTTSAAASVPNFAGVAKFGSIVDNGATWINKGNFKLVRLRITNSSASTAQATAQEYDLRQGV